MGENPNHVQPVLRVLLVDDELEFLKVIKKRMSKRNIDITPTSSGSEAIGVLRREDFDCAVVDLRMQDMDGIEVLKVLKRMAPEMPVLMLTGHGSAQAAGEGIALGAYDYLTKPCEFDELVKKIREAVKNSR